MHSAPNRSGFDGPATYRIQVEGRVPAKWWDRLEGMTVTMWTSETEPNLTRLQGELSDQAALAGVLNTLYELHLSVLSVERLTRQATRNPQADPRQRMKVIIVGGVAGGASCAARLRRLDENAEILMVERGPYVSYANCGLPYHVGGVIAASRACWWRHRTRFASSSASTCGRAAR